MWFLNDWLIYFHVQKSKYKANYRMESFPTSAKFCFDKQDFSTVFFVVKTGLNPNAAEFHPCMWSSFGPQEKSWDGLRLMLLKRPTISKHWLAKNIHDDDSTRMMNDGVYSFLIFFPGVGGGILSSITSVCVFGLAWLGFVCLFEGENSGIMNSWTFDDSEPYCSLLNTRQLLKIDT